MLGKEHIERVAENVWEIPKAFRDDMRVPARLYADEDLLDSALADICVCSHLPLAEWKSSPVTQLFVCVHPKLYFAYQFKREPNTVSDVPSVRIVR
jgi:tRNA-splicing ligase RtcB